MTEQEFDKLEWQFNSHFNTPTHHSTVDKCKTIPTLYRCIRVNYKDGEPTKKKNNNNYMLDFKKKKKKQKLLEAMNND